MLKLCSKCKQPFETETKMCWCKKCANKHAVKKRKEKRKLGYCAGTGCRTKVETDLKYCDTCLVVERARGRRLRLERRNKVLEVLGGACCVVPGCGICDPWMLNTDHIFGNGLRDTKSGEASLHALRQYKLAMKNPDELRRLYQVLCCNHNQQKQQFLTRGLVWSVAVASLRLKQLAGGVILPPAC